MRLVPDDRHYGFTPYVWLVYIVPFFVEPFFTGASRARIAVTIASGAVFLVLYFLGYWLRGLPLLGVIVAITLLGVIFTPINLGAPSMFIYAASFAGGMRDSKRGMAIVVSVLGILLIEAMLFHLPVWHWWWGALFTLIIGGVNVHYGQVRRQDDRLRLAQDEVEHLAKVAERERIARDLHDVLGHTLSLIILKSELASKLADRDPARARYEIRDVERISREALAEVRSAISGYRSGGLQDELNQAKEALETAGLTVACSSEALPPLTPAQEVVVALAVREAVTNVIRHAAARNCLIRIERDGDVCRLTVADDGRGGIGSYGYGLIGMRERVASLGGTLEHNSSHGTTLTIELPMASAPLQTLERGA